MSQRRIESFLLRLVVEDDHKGNTDDWRGRIQHVGSGYERQFANVQDLLTFMREQFGIEGASVTSEVSVAVQQHR